MHKLFGFCAGMFFFKHKNWLGCVSICRRRPHGQSTRRLMVEHTSTTLKPKFLLGRNQQNLRLLERYMHKPMTKCLWSDITPEYGVLLCFCTVTDSFFVSLCQIQLDSCPWKEHKADTGRIYYHNTETKESTWTIPKELAELKGKLDQHSWCSGGQGLDSCGGLRFFLCPTFVLCWSVTFHSLLTGSLMITKGVRYYGIKFACDFVLFTELIKQEQEQEE